MAVDQLVVEDHAFALQRVQDEGMDGLETFFRIIGCAESFLVGGQDQVVAEADQGPQATDGSGDETEFGERIDLFVFGFADDRAVAVDENGFLHGWYRFREAASLRFSSGVPTVMRRQPAQPGTRDRLRTMMPSRNRCAYSLSAGDGRSEPAMTGGWVSSPT